MDGLIEQALNATSADEWLGKNHLGWLVSDQAISLLSILVGSLVLYYIGKLLIARGIRHLIRGTAKHRAWHRKDIEKRETTLIELMKSFWRIVIIAYVAAMIASKLFGIDLSPIFASAGIIGIAIGFGSQSLVKDFLSGVFIIAENQYRVGDVVDIMGAAGTVERIGMRSTIIRDLDGNVHYIPNGTIQRVVNKTMGYSIARFTVEISPEVDTDQVIKVIDSVGEKLANEEKWKKKIIEAPRYIAVGEITEKVIELTVSGKTMPSDQWAVTSEMRSRLVREFEAKNIPIITLPTPSSSK
ncbi:hypothetical protein B7Y94_03565 [Candidatus Saccharibacteria bacterium 32-49-12]|nr:MAG: hypothetical protein B7Y94_03565 [Candidatus Saccharibacteria bacterium 32-49-12]